MRFTAVLPFVAAATAIVIPDEVTLQQLALDTDQNDSRDHPSSLWDGVPSLDDIRDSIDDIFSSAADAIDRTAKSAWDALPDWALDAPELSDVLPEWDNPGRPGRGGHHGGHGRHGDHRPSTENLTIYQVLHKSNHTKRFAKLVDDYPDLVKILNGTTHNVTLFVPIDSAFERLPPHEKPPKEFIEKVLQYHVLNGTYPAGRVTRSRTLPTLLEEELLGGKRQRIRSRIGLGGIHLNFYSKVVAADFRTKNGLIHAVNSILVPPPRAAKIISIFPSKFSTLILAVKKTGLGREIHDFKTTGGTVFAPNNAAFDRLGPRANAFLFNTERGLGYLKALLKYHIVANETLYSDAYYGKDKDQSDDAATTTGHEHLDLPTLLGDRTIAVDIARWFGFVNIKLNGYVNVAVQDIVARDSVIQVLTHILIPPHKRRGEHQEGAEIEVEDLIERLEPYVESQKDYPFGEL